MIKTDKTLEENTDNLMIICLTLIVYLLLHVPISLLLSLYDGSRRAQDGHLIQLEELLTQAVLQVLVQLAAGTKICRTCYITEKTTDTVLTLRAFSFCQGKYSIWLKHLSNETKTFIDG